MEFDFSSNSYSKTMRVTQVLTLLFLLFTPPLFGQLYEQELQKLYRELEVLKEQQREVERRIEDIKLARLLEKIKSKGIPKMQPGEQLITHSAMALVYDEQHEQAKWVAHIISPEIISGQVSRTNDFRTDPKVGSGSAAEADYFLKYEKADGSYEYDGYGYDRGHLAPSADFRWSEKALSESYFYSNMSPQLPEFNRQVWAELENALRAYIFAHSDVELMVVTGPLLSADSPKVERSKNGLSIPKAFWKVAIDLQLQKGIGFIIPHEEQDYPLSTFAVAIDEVEKRTGLDFFHQLPDPLEEELERQVSKKDWFPELAAGDAEPLDPTTLAPNHFNTIQAARYMNKNDEIVVCGKAVSSRTSRNGNILINLDKQYPNQIFTVFVRKEHIPNFSYDPEMFLKGKLLNVKGKVANLGGTPAMFIEDETAITIK